MNDVNDPNAAGDWSASDRLETLYLSLDAEDQGAIDQTVGELFELLASDDVRSILLEFALGSERQLYSDLEAELSIDGTMLSQRLQELTEVNLLHRTNYDGVPPKTEYRLTETGEGLVPLLLEAFEWARENEL